MKFQMVGLVLHCVSPLLLLESWKCQTVVYSLCIHCISQAAVSFQFFNEGFATCLTHYLFLYWKHFSTLCLPFYLSAFLLVFRALHTLDQLHSANHTFHWYLLLILHNFSMFIDLKMLYFSLFSQLCISLFLDPI